MATVVPTGFFVLRDVLCEREESSLVARVSALAFERIRFVCVTARRRQVAYGAYHPDARGITVVDGIPDWLVAVREIASRFGKNPLSFGQVSVTEYPVGAPIGWHADSPIFGPSILGISLVSSCTFRLRHRDDHEQQYRVTLQPRSAYLLTGEARYAWQHHIPPVKALRYSLTFRSLVPTAV